MKALYLGGSPCSGKSTLMRALAAHGWRGDSLDDRLDKWMHRAADEGKPHCTAYFSLSPDGVWMRPPASQCEDELGIYREIAPYVKEHLRALEPPFIAEGAALLPELLQNIHVPQRQALFLFPVPQFQIEHYRRRPWVPSVLKGCADTAAAFDRWMERDILFARQVARQAEAAGYRTVWVDGTRTPEQLLLDALEWFAL